MLFLSDLSRFQARGEDTTPASSTRQVCGWVTGSTLQRRETQGPQITNSEKPTRRFTQGLALLPECADLDPRIERR